MPETTETLYQSNKPHTNPEINSPIAAQVVTVSASPVERSVTPFVLCLACCVCILAASAFECSRFQPRHQRRRDRPKQGTRVAKSGVLKWRLFRRDRVIAEIMPLAPLMTRTKVAKLLATLSVAIAVVTVVFWSPISEAFGPMKQNELQCLICHRNRVKKWVCGAKVNDEITTNRYSVWIDTFTPLDHQHVWIGHTAYNRRYWFGGTSIACGGMPAIPRIFEQRSSVGELDAQKLAAGFQELIKGQSAKIDFVELDAFTKAVVDDPRSLLKNGDTD